MDITTKRRIVLFVATALHLFLLGILLTIEFEWQIFVFDFGMIIVTEDTAFVAVAFSFAIFVFPFIIYESGFLDNYPDEPPITLILSVIIKKIMLILGAIIMVGAFFVGLYWLGGEVSYLYELQKVVVRTLGPFYNSFIFVCYCLVAFGAVIVYFAIFDKEVNLEDE